MASGAGPRAVERSEAGGVIGNERHLHRSPVSSPTEELRNVTKLIGTGRRRREPANI